MVKLKNVTLLLVWPMRSEGLRRYTVSLAESAAGYRRWKSCGIGQDVRTQGIKDPLGGSLAVGSDWAPWTPCKSFVCAWSLAASASCLCLCLQPLQLLYLKLQFHIRHMKSDIWLSLRVQYNQGLYVSPFCLSSWLWELFSCLLNFCHSQIFAIWDASELPPRGWWHILEDYYSQR